MSERIGYAIGGAIVGAGIMALVLRGGPPVSEQPSAERSVQETDMVQRCLDSVLNMDKPGCFKLSEAQGVERVTSEKRQDRLVQTFKVEPTIPDDRTQEMLARCLENVPRRDRIRCYELFNGLGLSPVPRETATLETDKR